MKKQILIIFAICCSIQLNLLATTDPPKREFRGAWVATVRNGDWPSSPALSPDIQRWELVTLLDDLKEAGINAVVLQIRTECDALYESDIEPWSYWLTGEQGSPPTPFYDPLEFAIEEAHKRGMEIHAWFNPYRAVVSTCNYPIDSEHVSMKHPDWILIFPAYPSGEHKILDPGLPDVRKHNVHVIMDVVKRYDIDGVHFDDYFYPYPDSRINFSGITNEDCQTFSNYSRGITNIGDWRRDNVNIFVQMVYDSIQAVKPYVKFGISPFGIWKNGVPSGIVGLDAYNVIYADAITWLDKQIVDYVTPQLYWAFGGGQDYGKLLPWWASKTNGRHLIPGHAVYKISSWSALEVPNQIRLNRETPNVYGSIFFRALYFRQNPKGFTNTLKTDLYRYPALSPIMGWKDVIPPNEPQNLRYERLASTGPAGLRWDSPLIAEDGETAVRFVIYRFNKFDIQPCDLNDPAHIITIAGVPSLVPETPPDSLGPYYYTVTALDRISNESSISNVLLVDPPPAPILALPVDHEPNQPPDVTLSWHYPNNAATYHLQAASDSTFNTQFIIDEIGILDTFKIISGLAGQEKYYWRVSASNAGGTSPFSEIHSFITGFPTAPLLVYPAEDAEDISIEPTFSWETATSATSYHLQIANRPGFCEISILFDSTGIADTTFSGIVLQSNSYYFWRVSATNSIGTSLWSEIFKFKTAADVAVAEALNTSNQFKLYRSYPNPFNATTIITFDIHRASRVVLKIYDELGREIVTLVDGNLNPGHHKAIFTGNDLPSGVYFYRLLIDDQILNGKMLLLK